MKTILFILVLCISPFLRASVPLSLEHQAYEFVFNEIIQDAVKEVRILNTYHYGQIDGGRINPYEQMPKHLIKELISNKQPEASLSWKPVMVNATFINKPKKNIITQSFYYVSHVAVDKENLEAVLLLGFDCHPLCSNESLIHIKKYGLQWRIVTKRLLWVS